MNKRKKRILEIKRVRQIRDELLLCNNIGRQKYLLQRMPTVCTVNILKKDGKVKMVEIITYDYFSFEYWNENAFKILCNIAYQRWLSDYVT